MKVETGDAGYVLEDVPHLSDYIPNLPVSCLQLLSLLIYLWSMFIWFDVYLIVYKKKKLLFLLWLLSCFFFLSVEVCPRSILMGFLDLLHNNVNLCDEIVV